jgi:YVTN family beta-propeller protein
MTISRIDPATYEVVEEIEIGNAPYGITVDQGLVWVAVQAP